MNGVEHVPCVTDGAAPQFIGMIDCRTSYFAGDPVPSSTPVKDNCTPVASKAIADTSVTVPGTPEGGNGGGGGGAGGVRPPPQPLWQFGRLMRTWSIDQIRSVGAVGPPYVSVHTHSLNPPG